LLGAKKKSSPTLSSSEAEYIAVTSTACQAIWLRRILEGKKQHQLEATIIHCDNQSTIAMIKNPNVSQLYKTYRYKTSFY
jgi:hypothetical protein